MEKTFKQWMIDQYDQEELYTITEHGCISGCAGGLIYYSETCDLYDKHAEELHGALSNYEQEFGQWPDFVVKNLGSANGFKNSVVWFVAELYAYELTAETNT